MPKMGESIIEATVLKWLKQVGEAIEQEESVLEIATDKVDSEVPSPVEGKLLEVRFKEGDVVPVGEVIAIIETEAVENANGHHDPVAAEEVVTTEKVPYVPSGKPVEERVALGHSNGSDRFYSPLVMNIAREEGISMQELEGLAGSGRAGRVTKKDILSYVEHRTTAEIAVTEAPRAEPPQTRSVPAPTLPVTQAAIAAAPQIKFGHTGECAWSTLG